MLANGLDYRKLAEWGTPHCRLRPGLLVNLIIFLLMVPAICDESLLATGGST